MKRKPRLKYVKFQVTKGTLYAYFNTGKLLDGKTVWAPLPPYSSPGFFDSYSAMMGHRNRKAAAPVMTVRELIAQYEASDEFRSLKPSSRRNYRLQLDKVNAHFGDFPLDDVTPARVRAVLSKAIPGNATKNMFMAVIGNVYRFGRIGELTTGEPIKDIARFKTGEHEPWPLELLEASLACDNARVRLAVHLLYFTGQRIGDVCKMRWSSIRGNRVSVVQEKTSKPLLVAMHGDLASELQAAEHLGDTIIAQANGKALTTQTLRDNIQAFAEELGYEIVPHGLRKNAVNSLLEAGCTIQEVASVTGQSLQMIEHYAKGRNNAALSDSAMMKLERSRNVQTEVKTDARIGGIEPI